jgi:hypothetical protein
MKNKEKVYYALGSRDGEWDYETKHFAIFSEFNSQTNRKINTEMRSG